MDGFQKEFPFTQFHFQVSGDTFNRSIPSVKLPKTNLVFRGVLWRVYFHSSWYFHIFFGWCKKLKKSFLSNGPPVTVFQCPPSKTAKLLDISSLYSQCLSKHSLKSPPQRLRFENPLWFENSFWFIIYSRNTPQKKSPGAVSVFSLVSWLVGGGDCLFVEVWIFWGRSFFLCLTWKWPTKPGGSSLAYRCQLKSNLAMKKTPQKVFGCIGNSKNSHGSVVIR